MKREDLRKARIKAGLTQAELAKKIGVTQDAVSRYEWGKRPVDVKKAPLIARALRMSTLAVLYGSAKQVA